MDKLPNLDQTVLDSLDFFKRNPPPALDIANFNLPFVVGSGNAYNTGLIIFSEKSAIFADESNFKKIISSFEEVIKKKLITQAFIISASGVKDSVWEIELAKKYSLHTTLLTTKGESPAAKIADKVYVTKSITEPYTYNTSTYMGMILSKTKENPSEIKKYIESLHFPENFGDYSAYSFVVPDEYMEICPMIEIKENELFGSKISLRAFSQGHARHAKFIVKSKKELIISIDEKNKFFGYPENRWDIFPPKTINFAGIMALTYYIVGKIQASKPPYFKDNIKRYFSDYESKVYGATSPSDLIVPGSDK